MKRIEIPDDIVERLKFFCEKQNLGMASIGYKDTLYVIIIGARELGPDQASLLASHILIGGVLTNQFNDMNDDAVKIQEDEKGGTVQ